MFSRVIKSALPVSLTAIALFAGAAASAESVQTIQTLDRVDVYNKTKVLEMEFDDPGRTFDFTALGIAPDGRIYGFLGLPGHCKPGAVLHRRQGCRGVAEAG